MAISPESAVSNPKIVHIWAMLRWSLPFLAAFLPIVLLSLFSYQVASQSVRNQVERENIAAAQNAGQMLTQDFLRMAELAHAIASVSGTLDAIEQRDDLAIRERLRAIVLAYPQIDRVFLTDPAGVLWTDYPQAPGVFAQSQAESDWYTRVSQEWKTVISDMYVRPYDPLAGVVAIATPVRNKEGVVSAVLVFEYRTDQIDRWLKNIRLGQRGHVFILDGSGIAVAHPSIESDLELRQRYRIDPLLEDVRTHERFLQQEYVDPLTGLRMVAVMQSVAVGPSRWLVVAQQPVLEAYAVLRSVRLRISLAGAVLTFVTVLTVLALASAERKNEKLNTALEARNSTLQDITSFVSHQLRAPVTAMRWTIESMLDGDNGPVTPDLKTALTQLQDVAIQNGNLINDILNVSRIDRGVIEVAVAPVSLGDIAERALRDYRVALEKAGLSLTIDDAAAKVMVLADKDKMAEAVTNAISNAIKHTKQGGITIRMRSDASMGYIDVADTGEGMPPDIMQKLFNRAGVKGSNTDSSASTGLGLYIARNFMRLQKGDISVASEPGKGSTFTYSVPIA